MNSKVDFASGGIAIDKDRVLIVKNKPDPTRGGDGYWGFPKGHYEEEDGAYQRTALRELEEETGISEVDMLDGWRMRTFYTFSRKGKAVEKEVFWFIGETEQYEITLSHEHRNFMWLEWDDAENQLNFEQSKEVLRGARAQLRALGREI